MQDFFWSSWKRGKSSFCINLCCYLMEPFQNFMEQIEPTVFKVLKLVCCCWGPLKTEHLHTVVAVESPLKAKHLFMIHFGILWMDNKFSPRKKNLHTKHIERVPLKGGTWGKSLIHLFLKLPLAESLRATLGYATFLKKISSSWRFEICPRFKCWWCTKIKHNLLTIMSIKILAAVLKSLTLKTWK